MERVPVVLLVVAAGLALIAAGVLVQAWPMEERFRRTVDAARLAAPVPGEPVTEEEIGGLPEPARRWLRWAGVVGRPRPSSFQVTWSGWISRGPGQARQQIDARQYTSGPDVGRLVVMRMPLAGVVTTFGRDTLVRGEGRMQVRPFDLVTLFEIRTPTLAQSQLVTWVNDAALLAPSMLLVPEASFTAVDEGAFDVTFTDRGLSVRARILVDAEGALRDFVTEDRWYEDPFDPSAPARRVRWRTPGPAWRVEDGRRVPAAGTAVWDLPEGSFTYAAIRFVPGSLRYDTRP